MVKGDVWVSESPSIERRVTASIASAAIPTRKKPRSLMVPFLYSPLRKISLQQSCLQPEHLEYEQTHAYSHEHCHLL